MSRLLEPEFLGRLERLTLLSRRLPNRRASAPGERRSPSRGRSVEFAEHREYRQGDDVRHIDWNAYARLEKLFLKLFVEEREETLTVLVDCSASMEPKFLFARRLAAALGYVALCGYDRVAVGLLSDRLAAYRAPVRGRSSVLGLLKSLEEAPCGGVTDLDAALSDFGRRHPRPGTVVVVSDFLVPGAGLEGLRFLRYQRNQLFALQVLSPEELEPQLTGDLKLVDVETERGRELTLTPDVMAAYRTALERLCQELAGWCTSRGCGYALADSRTDLEELLLKTLRHSGLLA